MIELPPDGELAGSEGLRVGIVDLEGVPWIITSGWLLFKVNEGPGGMPFLKERRFERRPGGTLLRIGGPDGGLERIE